MPCQACTPRSPSATYSTRCSLLEAFCRVVCSNRVYDTSNPSSQSSDSDLADIMAYASSILTPRRSSIRPGKNTIATRADSFCKTTHDYLEHRSFFTMESKYIGIASQGVRPSNKVCVLLGCQPPFVLRPINSSQYQVVGECEAFVGLLLDNYRCVDDRDLLAYIDTKHDDAVPVEDPRLGPVPDKLQRADNGKGFQFFLYCRDR